MNKALKLNYSPKDLDKDKAISILVGLAENSIKLNDYKKALGYVSKGVEIIKDTKQDYKEFQFYLDIYLIKIYIKTDKQIEAKKLLDEISKNELIKFKNERIFYNKIQIDYQNKNGIEDINSFLEIVNSTLKVSLELSDKKLRVELLFILKKHYQSVNNLTLAFKYANQIIQIEEKEKLKQVSIVSINNIKPLGKTITDSEEHEIYYKNELEVASTHQKNFHKSRIQSRIIDIKTIFTPSKTLSGDYIGTFSLCNNDNSYLLILADVVGKGITASYISFMLDGIIQSIIYNSLNYTLKNIVRYINTIIADSLNSQGFVSLWAGIIDLRNNRLESVNAGHMPTYLLKKTGNVIELNEGCTILGIFKNLPEFESEIVEFENGDTLIAYTDGITEAMNSDEVLYEKNFIELINRYAKDKSFNFVTQLKTELKEYQDAKQIQDDISLIMVDYK